MAISFDASAFGAAEPATSLTFAHTCAGGASVLYVGLAASLYPDIVTDPMAAGAVIYNGVAMSRVAVVQQSNGSGLGASFVMLYTLLNPSSGTHNIVVTPSGSSYLRANSASFLGSSTSFAYEASATGTSFNTTGVEFDATITTITNNAWILAAVFDSLASGGSDGGDVNFTYNLNGGTQINHQNNMFLLRNGPMTIGSKTMGVSNTANNADFAFAMVSIPDTVGGAPLPFIMTLNSQRIG